MRTRVLVVILIFVPCLAAGCPDIVPGGNAGGAANLRPDAVQGYLAQRDLARPEIVRGITDALRAGHRYRKRVRDQRNRWTLLTAWIDQDIETRLHIVTSRDETCPVCKGTGNRTWNNDQMKEAFDRLPFETECLKCKGKGTIPHLTVETKHILSPEDYVNREAARREFEALAFRGAPAQTKHYVEQLASDDPRKRLAACRWLDQHWVRTGEFFQRYRPMLAKARYYEKSEEKKIMVWQFWAGKGLAGASDQAYYRIYADMQKGKIRRKGFFPEQ